MNKDGTNSHGKLVIACGSGGLESQDWCLILFRMYVCFLERWGIDYKIVSFNRNTIGIFSAEIHFEHSDKFSLESESGIHRLVRISPFDRNQRRHTSFVSVRLNDSPMYNELSHESEYGNQIRSYVMHPYKMVKDHRTGIETDNVHDILSGNIELFLGITMLEKTESKIPEKVLKAIKDHVQTIGRPS